MIVRDIMNTRVVTVEMDDTLDKVHEIFAHVHFHHIFVVSGKRLMGVISDRDLLKGISPFVGTISETPRDLFTLQKRAHQIMTRHPISIRKEATIEEAAQRLLTPRISCLPVMNDDEEIEGILSWKDLLPALLQSRDTRA